MPDRDPMDDRLRAVERALTGAETDLATLQEAGALADRLDDVESRLDDAADRLDALDAATQALRGYVGTVRHVNERVERRADAALAKAESLDAERGDEPSRYRQSAVPSASHPPAPVETDATDLAGNVEEPDAIDATDPIDGDEDGGLLAAVRRWL